ncbi:hypothetical protein ASJ81_17840 [Methanosarcina spelaei]|uniref:Uncharacterized protein n=1 Tax=Methanosarcina spelaei TaxID=1036679 RepID=A0A2A2HW21_9EURY|nr:hypothetical protein ASJ81_17840 [Methanosarcina spelaei]
MYIKEENKIKLSKNINIKCSKCIFIKFLLVQTSSSIQLETAYRLRPTNKISLPVVERVAVLFRMVVDFKYPFT